MRFLRAATLGAAGLVALFIAIEIWKRWTPDGFEAMSRQDMGFMVVLVILLIGALLLVRSISRELRGNSGP
jgi:hypothetical protein